MSDDKKEEPAFAKGDRAAIVGGKGRIGARGEVFWSGPNRYGPGFRYGLRGDDGDTYWVDEADLGPEEGAPPPPPPIEEETFDKGDRVRVTSGRDRGREGEVFWTGDSRYGPGKRYGVRPDAEDDDAMWIDGRHLELVAAAEGGDARPSGSQGPPPLDDAPLPEAPDEEGRGGGFEDAPAPASATGEAPPGFDDAPFPDQEFAEDAPPPGDDDIPF